MWAPRRRPAPGRPPELGRRPEAVSRFGVVSSVAAPVLLIGGWTLAAALQRGGFDQVSDTISALAGRNADHRWVMTTALYGVGLAHVVTAAALRPAGRPGRLLLALGGVATLAVAAAPLPGDGSGAPAHAVAAATAFVSLAIWPALAVRRDGPEPFRLPVALGATAVLLAELVWFFTELTGDGGRVGLSERVAAGSQALVPLIAVLVARRSRRGATIGA